MSKIDILLPVGLNDTVYIVESPCYVSGWRYHVKAAKIVEVNWKFDRGGRDIEWGFITQYGTRYKYSSLGKSWFTDKQDAFEKVESKNRNAKRHDS